MPVIESLPLFPLSDVVLFPEVTTPLYIFEPRYRQMTYDALEGGMQIGMTTVRAEGLQDMAGDPPLFDIGCLGRITQHVERPDGTYQMLLLGERRFRILREDTRRDGRLYRSADVELLDDVLPASTEETTLLETARLGLLDHVERLLRRPNVIDDPDRAIETLSRLDPTHLVHTLARSIGFEPIERQRVLEIDSVTERIETMSDLLRFQLADASLGEAESDRLPN